MREYCMKGEIRFIRGRLKFGDSKMDYVDTFEAVFDAGEWFSIDYCDDIKNVIAWMPLPPAYKGE